MTNIQQQTVDGSFYLSRTEGASGAKSVAMGQEKREVPGCHLDSCWACALNRLVEDDQSNAGMHTALAEEVSLLQAYRVKVDVFQFTDIFSKISTSFLEILVWPQDEHSQNRFETSLLNTSDCQESIHWRKDAMAESAVSSWLEYE